MRKMYRNLIKIILLITLYPLSFLVLRNHHLWVFGCYGNAFADNTKYQFLWATANASEIRAVWISGSKDVVKVLRERGYKAHFRWSLQGIFICLRAGIYIYSSYLGDINFYTSGRAMRVNLWHGVGLKKIEFKINDGALKKYFDTAWWNPYRLWLPGNFARPDFFLSTSPMMTEHFSECFRITHNQCFEGMYPRLIIHRDDSLLAQARRFGNYEGIESQLAGFKRKIVYMPTWRDNLDTGIVTAIPDVSKLNSILKNCDAVLVIKAHPNEKVPRLGAASNIILWKNNLDIYPLLSKFDCLITDYSSILYDFIALEKKEIILYNYDFIEYISEARDFAYPYRENTIGIWANDFNHLCSLIAQDNIGNDEEYQYIMKKFWSNAGANCKDLHKAITVNIN